jgi:hypothetical protein
MSAATESWALVDCFADAEHSVRISTIWFGLWITGEMAVKDAGIRRTIHRGVVRIQ